MSLDLEFLIPSFRTMGFSLILKLSKGTVVNWASRIGIQLRLIHRGMNKLKLSTWS